MVSKIAVMACVAIVAVPILLGYAFNLTETTYEEWESDSSPMYMTGFLRNSIEYEYTMANFYDVNSNNFTANGVSHYYPLYKTISSTHTSLPFGLQRGALGAAPTGLFLGQFKFYQLDFIGYIHNVNGYYTMVVSDQNLITVATVTRVTNVVYDHDNFTVTWSRIENDGSTSNGQYTNSNDIIVNFSTTGDVSQEYYEMKYQWLNTPSSKYADVADGYTLMRNGNSASVDFPAYARYVLLTMDLNTILGSTYSIKFDSNDIWYLEKTTSGGVPHWSARYVADNDGIADDVIDLYYDTSLSSNAYQIFIGTEKIEFRYIGEWPQYIGAAPAYITYSFDRVAYSGSYIPSSLTFTQAQTPIMRIDAVEYRSFEYQIIENVTYTPGAFKADPETTITSITKYGTSLSFGGNTYNVDRDGKIQLGTKKIPVDGLSFLSVPTDNGYENRIGNTVISTSVSPSTIAFNGKWSADVNTGSLTEVTKTQTEWVAGSFAWNGIDQTFCIVGLLTSIAAFIMISMYGHRSGSKVGALLLVCGGAALVFFTML